VWIGSYEGTILRTINGGRDWSDVTPAGATSDGFFNDLAAFDANHADAMAAGPGQTSRIYRTDNGGRSWRLAFQGPDDPLFFLDAMSFFDNQHGLAFSDPIDDKFVILSTSDGGRSWVQLPSDGMPAHLPGEFGIASGTSMTTTGHDVWFGSGGAAARIFHSRDGGRTWDVRTTPISHAPEHGAGVVSLAFRTQALGLAVGGDLQDPDNNAVVAAFSLFGSPWTASARQPTGVRPGVAWLPGTFTTAVTVGFSGSDVSYDAGLHWTRFDDGSYNSIACSGDGSCWASGENGRVAVLQR
jgi:photosystem II stability/assembly factor-like uncharacterized protein